jgi:hypothetical protein
MGLSRHNASSITEVLDSHISLFDSVRGGEPFKPLGYKMIMNRTPRGPVQQLNSRQTY